MNLAVSLVAKDSGTFVQIFCDQSLLLETTVNAALSFSSSDFKIGDQFSGHMKLFKMFVSPLGAETFTRLTASE